MFDEIRDLLADADLQMERVIILGLLDADRPEGDFLELLEDHTTNELAAMFGLSPEAFGVVGEDCDEPGWAILSRRFGYLLELMRPLPQCIAFDDDGEVIGYAFTGFYKIIFAYGDTLPDAVAQAIRKSGQVYDEAVARAREARGINHV
ncbi:MAG: hypothetical protein KUA35_10315 [Pseudodesulfovibrio sp.]|uniref:Uncharacterized protein n=1 Tax=Pseudodesulfovibrio aespoeensis (strain ATCC 700646 / DSM 10631 / Aspo-2) TaxID=643562 RepID=E6VUB8_PSEA9|nr:MULTISPECIES: hypothetical protein [Pseudodesulfovibrio]MBU4191358.1 hypothetical protein [Pseudomonadota bacterium]ADU63425.1 hypothetical protein Daes_2420 [Pseudodesulfovibrio aespoeensis Aspo-2]MBU4243472.1 hypothetical protein [Pseudomonadota bacterium]MBU4380035.1 hypothetical protein [Pseudomonadota bacterium]MBU4473806.1 hypothetical protein [Pseudomonadota bacterium]